MIRVAIVGATGYTGGEILDILLGHSGVEVTSLSAKLDEPVPLHEEFPRFRNRVDILCTPLDPAEVAAKSDVVFLSLPHGVSMKFAPFFCDMGKKVIDLSADFRFSDRDLFEKWYGIAHEAEGLLGEAVYGLPELHAVGIKKARLVANPGCYPTGAILALAPLFSGGLAPISGVVIDSKSGVTGAGRKGTLALSFGECNESFRAYKVGRHQHTPEIEAELGKVAGHPVQLLFTPHLVPMNRGILTTAYLTPRRKVPEEELRETYSAFYARAPFVRVLPGGALPDTKDVSGQNFCDIAVLADGRTGRLVVISAIDNLMKGAAGQAVQNMNLMCGFPETEGLR